MRVLLTGVAGFIGSHLALRLLDMGYEVVGADNFSTGSDTNLRDLVDHCRFQFVHCDVTSGISVHGPFDWVLHFASPASPPRYQRLPIETLRVNSEGTYHLLELARNSGARFFLASTSEVYGDPLVHPQPESYWGNVNPVGPRSVYDEAKRYAEALTMAYHRTYGLDVRIVRIFNTYGPRMDPADGRVVSTFITQALTGRPLTVYGDGCQTRSFCYVDDMVEGIIRLMERPIQEPVNLGNPEEFTILELANLVLELTGSSSPIVFRPLPEDDPRQRRPDITRARQLLGWGPKVSLREGLRRTIEYFHQVLADGQLQAGVGEMRR
ncbi:UDP-glucuronic acid decarboxylase family protein [Thermaerobacter composti]|uniref:SDR family oxidoreductase n=1 Tax=Thermaerobacter composti TaxID=554949 RepID=A0ABZ0QQE3_9FIRM|nr:UDP-glucuronic acid decarboxylase family protein [Thermaerobacter composti]WPD19724.1 SDR family oxidoreductase [Thermaerobacter composti]